MMEAHDTARGPDDPIALLWRRILEYCDYPDTAGAREGLSGFLHSVERVDQETVVIRARIPRDVAHLLDQAKIIQGRRKSDVIAEGIVLSIYMNHTMVE